MALSDARAGRAHGDGARSLPQARLCQLGRGGGSNNESRFVSSFASLLCCIAHRSSFQSLGCMLGRLGGFFQCVAIVVFASSGSDGGYRRFGTVQLGTLPSEGGGVEELGIVREGRTVGRRCIGSERSAPVRAASKREEQEKLAEGERSARCAGSVRDSLFRRGATHVRRRAVGL